MPGSFTAWAVDRVVGGLVCFGGSCGSSPLTGGSFSCRRFLFRGRSSSCGSFRSRLLRGGSFCRRSFCRRSFPGRGSLLRGRSSSCGSFRSRLFRGGLLRSAFFLRHFSAFFPGFGKPDSDRLFAARYFFSATAAFQLPVFFLMHCLFDLVLRFFRILCHIQ